MNPTESLQATIDASCQKLEETASTMGVVLKRNPASVAHLEEIIVALAEFGVDEPTMSGATFMVGVYLGEILRNELSGIWAKSVDGDLILNVGDIAYPTVAKARKFAANPAGGDSLVFFVNVVLAQNA